MNAVRRDRRTLRPSGRTTSVSRLWAPGRHGTPVLAPPRSRTSTAACRQNGSSQTFSTPFDMARELISRQRWLALPGPPALDFKRECPTEEGANQHEAREQAQAEEGELMCDRLDDIGRDKDFETQQQRAPDADLVDVGVLLGNRLPQLAIR